MARALPMPSVTPQFQTSAAASLAAACQRAYAGLRSVSMRIEGGEASSVVWQSGSALQTGVGLTWTYDGTTLYILDSARRRLYRGHVVKSLIPDYLGLFHAREEPILLQLMARENPMVVLYARRQRGGARRLHEPWRRTGSNPGISSKGVRTLVQIRTDNHLIAGLRTRIFRRTARSCRAAKRTSVMSRSTSINRQARFNSPPRRAIRHLV